MDENMTQLNTDNGFFLYAFNSIQYYGSKLVLYKDSQFGYDPVLEHFNSVVSVRKTNYTDRATAACRRS
jgi:hypothetical protein